MGEKALSLPKSVAQSSRESGEGMKNMTGLVGKWSTKASLRTKLVTYLPFANPLNHE